MILNVTNIPSTPRSKHYQKLNFSSSNGIVVNEGTQVDNPFSYTSDGNLILTDKKLYFNENYIDESKVISWDNAVSIAHQHSNKTYIDTINQNLSSSVQPTFKGILCTDAINMNKQNIWNTGTINFYEPNKDYRISSNGAYGISTNVAFEAYGLTTRGVLNMNNNNVWGCSNIDFNAYETEGVVKWNTISNLGSLGFGFNNRITVNGNIELSGANKDIFTNNGDIALVRYKPDWSVGSQLRMKDNAVAINNLSVEGSLNCFELVANKVRSTNGRLYVSDSAVIKSIVGYDGPIGVWVIFEETIFQDGDIFLVQQRTSTGIKSLKFRAGHMGSTPNTQYCARLGDIDVRDLKAGDYCVKIDSIVGAFTIDYMYDNNKVIEFNKNSFSDGEIYVCRFMNGNEAKSKTIKITYKPSLDSKQFNYNIWYNNEWIGVNDIPSLPSMEIPKVGEMFFKEGGTTRNTGILLDPYDGAYIDFYSGYGDGSNKDITTSLGNLNHLNISGMKGYGLYSDNAYIKGKINATDAEINRMFKRPNISINLDVPSNERPNKLDFIAGNCYFIYCNQGGGEYNFQIEDPNSKDFDGVQLQVILCTEGSPETGVIIDGWNNLADTAKELASHGGIGMTTYTFTYVYQLTVGVRRVGWVLTNTQKSNIY